MGLSFVAPLAGRDQGLLRNSKRRLHFNPRAPCGARQSGTPIAHATTPFQSTHPLRGATVTSTSARLDLTLFQSTHPLRGATMDAEGTLIYYDISIHAPLAGCDLILLALANGLVDFNPRTPCGVRQQKRTKNAALLRKRYKYKFFVCKKCTSGDLTGAYSSKNTLYSGAKRSENPCALSVRTQRISGPSTSNPGLMPKCSILERYFSPR